MEKEPFVATQWVGLDKLENTDTCLLPRPGTKAEFFGRPACDFVAMLTEKLHVYL
jgi:hypothetical protein